MGSERQSRQLRQFDQLWQLCGVEGNFWVYFHTGEPDLEMTYYGEVCGDIVIEIAATTSRESALAVMRLHGVTEYYDWTQKGASWGMAATMVP